MLGAGQTKDLTLSEQSPSVADALDQRLRAELQPDHAPIGFNVDASDAVARLHAQNIVHRQTQPLDLLCHSCGPRWPATPDSNAISATLIAQPQFEKPSTVSNVTVKERPESSERTAPPKRWRNKWRARKNTYFDGDSQWAVEGEVWFGSFVWPSREVAEQKAADEIEDDRLYFGDEPIEYLGAFPIEEAA